MQVLADEGIILSIDEVDALLKQAILDNPHAKWGELRVIEVVTFDKPFENGTNIGEVRLNLNAKGNEAIYGIYTEGSTFQLFAN